ncbi:MAG: hypothetical protein OEZ15_11695, partial [Gammaproteobacteria bacterium]|nr:hypothetical protein [Gammaproteobacteria bacterium]
RFGQRSFSVVETAHCSVSVISGMDDIKFLALNDKSGVREYLNQLFFSAKSHLWGYKTRIFLMVNGI